MILIKGGHVVDPKNNLDGNFDILVDGSRIAAIDKDIVPGSDYEVVDAKGLLVFPGLIDMHVHLREPGLDHKETIVTGLQAAA